MTAHSKTGYFGRKKYNGTEDHHIVAREDRRAKYTVKLIGGYGITTSDKYNIVTIKKLLHKHLHTNAYFAAVHIYLYSCKKRYGTYESRKNAIIGGLLVIKTLLQCAGSAL